MWYPLSDSIQTTKLSGNYRFSFHRSREDLVNAGVDETDFKDEKDEEDDDDDGEQNEQDDDDDDSEESVGKEDKVNL